ncbi:MAG TPA: winged helix-turn-helix domain-containing protein, partial [Gemmatimonadaceae bacterium]|nr:winged helix-turn-helix domain-containing protein [Gemmatimonadaceae bacterium]
TPRIEFAVTPRFDVFYALYTIGSAAATPFDAWKAMAIRRLPSGFADTASRVAPLPIFCALLADAAQGAPGEISFDELLSTIRDAASSDLQRNILGGIFHDQDVVASLIAGRRSLKQVVTDENLPGAELLTAFGLKPYDPGSAAARAINSLLKQPKPFRDDLTKTLETFWSSGFHDDWNALESALRDESFRLREVREEATPSTLDTLLGLPVSLDDSAQQIRPKTGSPIRYQQIDRCYVIPSAFNARKWWTKYQTASGRLTLYFPVARELDLPNQLVRREPARAARESATSADINAESVFRALGDTTRYAIASILARAPTTSAELARSLNVSKPTITHHVQALRSAGLIRETPSGGSTRLSLSRDTVAALSGAAVEQLFSSSGELTLGTTRRKKNG